MLFNLLTIQIYNELLVTRIKGIKHHSKNIVDTNIAFYEILKSDFGSVGLPAGGRYQTSEKAGCHYPQPDYHPGGLLRCRP